MARAEEKIVKIIDADVHTRGANVVQSGSLAAVVVKSAEAGPMDSTQLNASYELTNTNGSISETRYLTKTIAGTSYRRTLSYNSDGEVLEVSVWTEL